MSDWDDCKSFGLYPRHESDANAPEPVPVFPGPLLPFDADVQMYRDRHGHLWQRQKSSGAWEDWRDLTKPMGCVVNGDLQIDLSLWRDTVVDCDGASRTVRAVNFKTGVCGHILLLRPGEMSWGPEWRFDMIGGNPPHLTGFEAMRYAVRDGAIWISAVVKLEH